MTKPGDTIRVLIPLKVRKKNGRPKILPPADYCPSEDQAQDPHILRAMGRAWGWRRRMDAGEFATITETLRQAPVTAKAARDYQRVMFAGAHDEIPDRQGRITIPAALRTYAGLEKDCVVIGANTRVEIWDATAWNEYLADREKSFADVSEEVFPGLF